MLTLSFRVKDNWRTMIKIEKDLERGVGQGTKATADAIVADIRSKWSASSPSAWGSPPAKVSGVLDESILVEDQGRESGGQFGSKMDEGLTWYIHVDTSDLDPYGYNYAMALEDPDYLNRPFLAPALERAEGYFTSNIKRFVRL